MKNYRVKIKVGDLEYSLKEGSYIAKAYIRKRLDGKLELEVEGIEIGE